jgi:hypothetical protein
VCRGVAIFFANAQFPDVAVKNTAIAAFTNGIFFAEPGYALRFVSSGFARNRNAFRKRHYYFALWKLHVYLIENVRHYYRFVLKKQFERLNAFLFNFFNKVLFF